MAKSLVILLLCLSSVYADPEMKVEVPKDEAPEKIDDTSASVKSKRYSSWPVHPTPCPPHWPHYQHGWQMPVHQKIQFVQPHYVPKPHYLPKPQYIPKPVVTIVKPHGGWSDPWQQQNHGWSKPSHGWQSPGWQLPGWQSDWKPSAWQTPGWQSGWNKPAYSYTPTYHKPSYHVPIHNDWVKPVAHQPDCPPWQHGHGHTGIVYAPQHQYHHQPQVVKVAKPVYHRPQPAYHHTPSFHYPVHHSPHVEPCD